MSETNESEEKFKGWLDQVHQKLTLLNKRYMFRSPSEVFEFLVDNSSLINLVAEAYGKIRAYFPSAKLILEILNDPILDKRSTGRGK